MAVSAFGICIDYMRMVGLRIGSSWRKFSFASTPCSTVAYLNPPDSFSRLENLENLDFGQSGSVASGLMCQW